MSKWTKKTYQLVADVLSEERDRIAYRFDAGDPAIEHLLEEITDDFIRVFRLDNPRFERVRFLEAIGYDPEMYDLAKKWEGREQRV